MTFDRRDTPMTPEEILGRIGLRLMNCDCNSQHWLLAADPKGRFVIVSCAMCYACSSPLVPQDKRDLKMLGEACEEIEAEDAAKRGDDWGAQTVTGPKKPRDPEEMN